MQICQKLYYKILEWHWKFFEYFKIIEWVDSDS